MRGQLCKETSKIVTNLLTSNLVLQKHGTGFLLTGHAEPVVRIRDLDAIVGSHILLVVYIDSLLRHVGELAVRTLGVSRGGHSEKGQVFLLNEEDRNGRQMYNR